MTRQTQCVKSLGGSPAGAMRIRWSTLTLAAVMATGSVNTMWAQDAAKPDGAKPDAPAAKQATSGEKKTPAAAKDHVVAGYRVHSMVELGGLYVQRSGSDAMWATMVNETSGGRVLGQSLDMHTVNPSKTPFFDSLSTSSFGYGGDPYDVTMLKMNKGRWYDFMGRFRRDRNYFDYNLLANSLLGPNALIPEPDSLHLFNTVRRNTATQLTLFPVAVFMCGRDLITTPTRGRRTAACTMAATCRCCSGSATRWTPTRRAWM